MFDVNCSNNICPICGSLMVDKSIMSIINKECKNDCYKIIHYLHPHNLYCVFIFNKTYHSFGRIDREQTAKRVENKVFYWKENERYILKILELEI